MGKGAEPDHSANWGEVWASILLPAAFSAVGIVCDLDIQARSKPKQAWKVLC